MSTLELTDETFKQEVIDEASKPILVDFWAEWCGPCKMMNPIINRISDTYSSDLKVCKINTDDNPETPQQYSITGIPCCILFKGGEEIARIVGYKSEDQFIQEIKTHITLH